MWETIAINDLGIMMALSNAAPSASGAVTARVNQKIASRLAATQRFRYCYHWLEPYAQ